MGGFSEFLKHRYLLESTINSKVLESFSNSSSIENWFVKGGSSVQFEWIKDDGTKYAPYAKLCGNTWPYCAIQSIPKMSYIFWKQYFPSAENPCISNGNWNNLSKYISFYLRSDGKPLIINIYTKSIFGSFGPKILYQAKLKPVPNIWKIYKIPWNQFKAVRGDLYGEGKSIPISEQLSLDSVTLLNITIPLMEDSSQKTETCFELDIKRIAFY